MCLQHDVARRVERPRHVDHIRHLVDQAEVSLHPALVILRSEAQQPVIDVAAVRVHHRLDGIEVPFRPGAVVAT